MFDATYPLTIPAAAGVPDYAAGYRDGRWAFAFDQIVSRYPSAVPVSITAIPGSGPSSACQVCDCENGDYTPAQAAAWAAVRLAVGLVPTIYCSFATWAAVQGALNAIGIAVERVDWWIAAYPGIGAVLYPGSVAHQWIDHGAYDESVVVEGWRPGRPVAQPPAPPKPHQEGARMFCTDPVTGGVWATDETGALYALDGAPYIEGANLNTHPNLGAGNPLNPCVGIAYWKAGGVDGIAFYTRPTNGKGGIAGTPYSQYRWTRSGKPA
jgi:hypothetical protein